MLISHGFLRYATELALLTIRFWLAMYLHLFEIDWNPLGNSKCVALCGFLPFASLGTSGKGSRTTSLASGVGRYENDFSRFG